LSIGRNFWRLSNSKALLQIPHESHMWKGEWVMVPQKLILWCYANLSTCHFANLPFCQLAILPTCQFANLTFCLNPQHFTNLSTAHSKIFLVFGHHVKLTEWRGAILEHDIEYHFPHFWVRISSTKNVYFCTKM
jgi:hypothetical protein